VDSEKYDKPVALAVLYKGPTSGSQVKQPGATEHRNCSKCKLGLSLLKTVWQQKQVKTLSSLEKVHKAKQKSINLKGKNCFSHYYLNLSYDS
jgi:hypothetical protein